MNAVKKFFNILLILFGIVLIAICADLMTNKLTRTEFKDLDETDRGAIEELCEITSLFDDEYGNENIWNDSYNPRNNASMITRRYGMVKGSTYAVNLSVTKNMFAQRITMPEEYSDIPVYRFSYLTPFTFALAKKEDSGFTDVEGRMVYAACFDTQSVKYNGTDSLEESFVKNTFEREVESADVPTIDENVHYDLDVENIALTGLQFRILDDMLAETSEEKLKEMISEYVTVREFQEKKFPEFAHAREQRELRDGCAQYVFYNISDLIDHDITYFNKEKSDSITFYSAYYYLCTGRYNSDVSEFLDESGNVYSGAALCRIINDNELIRNWSSKISGDEVSFSSPYSLLQGYCSKKCSKYYNEKDINDIKRTYNYDEVISMARALMREIKE